MMQFGMIRFDELGPGPAHPTHPIPPITDPDASAPIPQPPNPNHPPTPPISEPPPMTPPRPRSVRLRVLG